MEQTRAKVQELSGLRDSGTADGGALNKQLRKEQTKVGSLTHLP